MAEAVGLALGVAALASLLSDCVEVANQITLAKNLGSDSEIVYTRFLTLEYRLVACGDRLSMFDQLQNNQHPRLLVQRTLVAIKRILENVDDLKRKYGLALERSDSSVSKHSPSLVEVEAVLRTSARSRQRMTSPLKKLTWAVHDKKAFENLNSDLAIHLETLESLLTNTQHQSPLHVASLVTYNMSLSALQLLEAATTGPDVTTAVTAQNGQKIPVHSSQCQSYLRNQIKDRARVIQGDIGHIGDSAVHHAYWENAISGNAKVIQGNATSEALKDFWSD